MSLSNQFHLATASSQWRNAHFTLATSRCQEVADRSLWITPERNQYQFNGSVFLGDLIELHVIFKTRQTRLLPPYSVS